MSNYCIKCGNKLKGNEKYCIKCGNNIDGSVVINDDSKKVYTKNKKQMAGFITSVIGLFTCGFLSLFGLIISIVEIIDGKKNNKNNDLTIVGLVVSSVMLILLAGFIFIIVTAKDVVVVDFSTMSYTEAKEYCKKSESNCSVYEEYSDTLKKGEYIRQSEKAGDTIKSYWSVDVYYSKGAKPEKKSKKKHTETSDSNEGNGTTQKNSENIINSKNLSEIKNDTLKSNFVKACNEINMNISEISNLKKVDDWNSGPRYTFNYKSQSFILYALDNGEVSSITIANNKLDKIYLDGYESVDVNDFLFSESVKSSLIVLAEEKIESYLKDPSSAKFKQLEFGFARRYDIYQITGTFTAKNSFNAKVDSKFIIEFKGKDESFSVVYLNIDGKNFIGSKSNLKEITRKERKSDVHQDNDGSIIIKDGVLGEYGRKDKFDGEEYIRYYIPAGTYKVEALTKNAMFYVETIKLHKEDGFDTATTIKTIKLDKVGDIDTFTIKKDQCISLVMYTQIKLTKEK